MGRSLIGDVPSLASGWRFVAAGDVDVKAPRAFGYGPAKENSAALSPFLPAQAGTQFFSTFHFSWKRISRWVPAFAGTSGIERDSMCAN